VRPNQLESTDITYIRLAHGFAYLVAVMPISISGIGDMISPASAKSRNR
jgi:hypothetical protein